MKAIVYGGLLLIPMVVIAIPIIVLVMGARAERDAEKRIARHMRNPTGLIMPDQASGSKPVPHVSHRPVGGAYISPIDSGSSTGWA